MLLIILIFVVSGERQKKKKRKKRRRYSVNLRKVMTMRKLTGKCTDRHAIIKEIRIKILDPIKEPFRAVMKDGVDNTIGCKEDSEPGCSRKERTQNKF